MLNLYGFDVSNYHNMLKLVIAIKGIDCEVVTTYPNQSPEYLAISPAGKVPALKTHIKKLELYLEVPVPEITKKEVKKALLNGIQALSRAASFSPYVAGKTLRPLKFLQQNLAKK